MSCFYLFLLRFWWIKPLYGWAFNKALGVLENGQELDMILIVLRLRKSKSIRYTATLLHLLMILPDQIIENSSSLCDAFSMDLLRDKGIKPRIWLCQSVLIHCFHPNLAIFPEVQVKAK